MNQQIRDLREVTIALPREVDEEVAGDIEKESVFVSPGIDRIVVNADMKTACVKIRPNAHSEELLDKAKRFLEVMSKQTSGFDIKVFNQNQRQDTGPTRPMSIASSSSAAGCTTTAKARLRTLVRFSIWRASSMRKRANSMPMRSTHSTRIFPRSSTPKRFTSAATLTAIPMAVTFIGNMMEDFDAIEEFRAANSCSEGALLPPQEHVHNDGMCLNPAACFRATDAHRQDV